MKSSLFLLFALLCIAVAKPVDEDLIALESQKQNEELKAEARVEPEEDEDRFDFRGSGIRQYVISVPELQEQQFKAFDDSGRYSFGYAFPKQVHLEARDSDGTVKGTYIYRDPEGRDNQVQYQADALGFRVLSDNSPVFHSVLPEPVKDTAEVEEARKQHLALWNANYKFQTGGAVEVPQDASQASSDEGYVAPLDLPPRPQSEAIVDSAKQAVIVQGPETEEAPDSYDIESDPVKLLAQLYSDHLTSSDHNQEPIQRPKDFYPQNIPETYNSFDLFRRTQPESVVITNPEFIDLKAFVLTNRFRTALDSQDQDHVVPDKKLKLSPKTQEASQIAPEPEKQAQAEDTKQDQLEKQAQIEEIKQDQPEKPAQSQVVVEKTVEKSVEKTQVSRPIIAQVYTIPQELYNQYFNLAPGSSVPVFLTRDGLDKLPESLKAVAFGLPSIDGSHDAQVAPYQKVSSTYPRYLPKTGPSPYFIPYVPGQPYPVYPFHEYSTLF